MKTNHQVPLHPSQGCQQLSITLGVGDHQVQLHQRGEEQRLSMTVGVSLQVRPCQQGQHMH